MTMVLINKHTKLSPHMASMPISNKRLINLVMLICYSSSKTLLSGVNVVHFSIDHNISAVPKQTSYGIPGLLSSNFLKAISV